MDVPIVRLSDWRRLVLVLGILALLVGVFQWLAVFPRRSGSFLLAAALFVLYSQTSRRLLTRHHRRGMKLIREGDFAGAAEQFARSLRFFEGHRFVDRFRTVLFFSTARYDYRELAMLNLAFCHGQLGDGDTAAEWYRRCLRLRPDNGLAQSGLNMLQARTSARAGES